MPTGSDGTSVFHGSRRPVVTSSRSIATGGTKPPAARDVEETSVQRSTAADYRQCRVPEMGRGCPPSMG